MKGGVPGLTQPRGGRTPGRPGAAPGRVPDTGTPARPRVLIVDDDDETREMYAWCMRAAGWHVDTGANGEEALFVALAFAPDVIVMDLRLPVFDGFETTRRLKANAATRHIPVVACSGIDWPRAPVLARQAGCVEFVAKPCLPERLRQLLEGLV